MPIMWLKFDGTAEKKKEHYDLSANGNILRADLQDVRIEKGVVQLKKGARVQRVVITSNPRSENARSMTDKENIKRDCPSGRTYCIGAVEFCCDNDETLGWCAGVWDCGG